MSNANKNKGKNGERELCGILSKVFGINFIRVPNSGAFTGGFNSFRKSQLTPNQELLMSGDIIMPTELSGYEIEVKTYKSFSFNALFNQNACLDKWIVQASSTNKTWFLCFKINNCGWFVVFDSKLVRDRLITLPGNYLIYKTFTISSIDNFFELNQKSMLDNNLKNNIMRVDDQAPTPSTT